MPSTPRPRRGRAPAVLVLLAALALLAAAVPAAAAAPPPSSGYRPPVAAAVSDPFRAPTSPYGPGNRGLQYDTAPGAEVRAAAAGRVTFAGAVAGTRHVTILHADGIRTTASYLAAVAVVVGQEVEQGDLLGTTEGRLHFGARSGDGYLDPAALFGDGPPVVWLVPFDLPPGLGLAGECSAIQQLLGLGAGVLDLAGRAVDASGDAAGEAVAWVRTEGGDLVRLALEYGWFVEPHLLTARLVAMGVGILGDAWAISRRPCTEAGAPISPPAQRRTAVLVGGLGSTSGSASVYKVDHAALGYDDADVVRFSYAGGRTPQSTGKPEGVPERRYTKPDSQQDLRESGRRLADLVEQVAAASPGVPIDLIAHSQGGVVSRLAIIELERRGAVGVLGSLATIGSPHDGADLATAAHLAGHLPMGRAVLERLGPRFDLDPDGASAEQLSEASGLIDELARTPLPPGLPAVSIAGRGDLIVPAPRTQLDGATSVVVPLVGPDAHTNLPSAPETTRELLLALVGAPPGCRGITEALLDEAVGEGISLTEDGLGLVGTGLATVGSGIQGVGSALEAARDPR